MKLESQLKSKKCCNKLCSATREILLDDLALIAFDDLCAVFMQMRRYFSVTMQ